ncbi:MAG: RICIN domain-containing protein, partial [Acidimicrobiales bacterium]
GSTGSDGDGGPATNAQLDNPYDVAVGTNGNVYIADTVNNRIRHVDTNGIITTIAGTASSGFSGDNGPATNASLAFPLTIAVDNDSNLYIADTGGHRIRQIDTNGIITTIAGTGNTGFSGDNGPATNATLTNSSGIAVGADGSLYIADAGSHRVRVVVVDTTDPAIDLTGVNDGATITNGANATLGFTCTDT